MGKTLEEIEINGIIYIPKSAQIASDAQGLPYVMVRTYSAGVFAGYLQERINKEVTLVNARRIYYWDGAASLSQLATDGTSKPQNCKFPCEVSSVTLTEVIELIPISKKAQKSISEVAIWKI